jgi:DNA-binding MarR family transcriptional regulator
VDFEAKRLKGMPGRYLNQMENESGMLLLKDKQARIILMLAGSDKEWHLSSIARETGVTYIHTSRFVSRCEEKGIIGSEVHGKLKKIFLTEKGKKIAEDLKGIISKINEVSEPEATGGQQVRQPLSKPSSA